LWWSKSVAKRHKAAARTRMTSPSNLPSQHSAPTRAPTRPPRPRCRVRSALRLWPSAEAPHGRQTTTLRRGFVPVGAIAVRGQWWLMTCHEFVENFWNGVKVFVTRWLCRFFLVISVDAPRRALGRDIATFSSKKRRAPASTRQNRPFSSILFLVPLKKMTKRCETSRTTRSDTTSFL